MHYSASLASHVGKAAERNVQETNGEQQQLIAFSTQCYVQFHNGDHR